MSVEGVTCALTRCCPSPTPTPEELERRAIIQRNDLILHEAVIKNDTETVKKILREPVDINSRNNVSFAHPVVMSFASMQQKITKLNTPKRGTSKTETLTLSDKFHPSIYLI